MRDELGSGVPVVVTAGDQVGSLATVRALRSGGYEPFGVGPAMSYVRRSRASAGYQVVPDAGRDPAGFASVVREFAQSTGAAVIVPGTETDALALLHFAEWSGGQPLLANGDLPAFDRATDKRTIGMLASHIGLDSPPVREVTADSLDRVSREIGFPAVLKPPRSVQRVAAGFKQERARLVQTLGEARSTLTTYPQGSGLLQDFVQGRLISVAGLAWDGRFVGVVQQEALRTWPRSAGNMSFARTVTVEGELRSRLHHAASALGCDGVIQFQLIDDGSNFHLIDINPRLYGSIGLAVAAGVNLPSLWIDALLEKPLQNPSPRRGVYFRNWELDLRAAFSRPAYVLDHRALLRAGVSTASFRDPLPIIFHVQRLIIAAKKNGAAR